MAEKGDFRSREPLDSGPSARCKGTSPAHPIINLLCGKQGADPAFDLLLIHKHLGASPPAPGSLVFHAGGEVRGREGVEGEGKKVCTSQHLLPVSKIKHMTNEVDQQTTDFTKNCLRNLQLGNR